MGNKLIKYRPEWFGAYGLDVNKNFLQSPKCDCGCGEKYLLLLKNRQDLFEFMFTVLMENDCNHCAIFAHSFDGKMYAALKIENDEDEPVLFFGQEENRNYFYDWDKKLNLHFYGLIIESSYGKWKIIDD